MDHTRRLHSIVRQSHLITVCLIFLMGGIQAQDWTAVPVASSGTPPQNSHPGHFEHRVTQTGPDGRDKIEFRWVPPDTGSPCAPTVLVQTVRLRFEHEIINDDGSVTTTVETLDKKSDLYKGMDLSDLPGTTDEKNEDEQVRDPNTIEGTFVDSQYCEGDPAINGGDEVAGDPVDHGKKGDTNTPSDSDDSPTLGDAFFTGTRKKYIAEFEVCAYCYNPNRTLGQVLGCFKWIFEKEKGKQGKISVPDRPSDVPTLAHTAAMMMFESRHTLVGPEGERSVYCPERGVKVIQEEIKRLRDALDNGAPPPLVNEIKRGIEARLEEIRRLRGR